MEGKTTGIAKTIVFCAHYTLHYLFLEVGRMSSVNFRLYFDSIRSYIERPQMEGNIGRALSIEVWFKATMPNGVIFYNGQLNNGKQIDKISLRCLS